jgi:hypothetical protein
MIEKAFAAYLDWLHEAPARACSPRTLWLLFSEWYHPTESNSMGLRLASFADRFLRAIKQVHVFFNAFNSN